MASAPLSRTFERSAGAAGVVVGGGGFLYSVAFVIVSRAAPASGAFLAALFLFAGGVLAIEVLVALYRRLRDVDPGFALLGFMFGFAGALGSAIHGAYDLANILHPPTGLGEGPSPVDPRGLLTFGVAGLGVFLFARLMTRGGGFPHNLARLGYLSAVLLVLIYLGRLIVLDATSPLILVPAAFEGFIVNPIWYVWVGLTFWRGART